MPKQMKETNMKFLNKGNNKLTMSGWRPISLQNVDRKILTSILADRIKNHCKEEIHETQTGATEGRCAQESVRILVDTLELHEERKDQLHIAALDNSGAFDWVHRDTLYKILDYYGLTQISQWIRHLYTGTAIRYEGNGMTVGVPMEEGIHQGCPLSPILYVLYLNPLLIFLKNSTNITGYKMPNVTESLKLVAHMDDVTLLGQTKDDLERAIAVVHDYANRTGIKINHEKTQLWNHGAEPIKVLGVWLGQDHVNKNYQEIYNKIKATLDRHKARNLSLLGRAKIAQVLGYSKLYYRMRILGLEKTWEEAFNELIWDFVWDRIICR